MFDNLQLRAQGLGGSFGLLPANERVTRPPNDQGGRGKRSGAIAEAQKMNPSAFAGNARALERFDYRGATEQFHRPVKVVVGEKDIIITKEMAEATARAFPNAELDVLEGVGHSVMVEAPDRFISVLKAFL